jgi:hypothetical protein
VTGGLDMYDIQWRTAPTLSRMRYTYHGLSRSLVRCEDQSLPLNNMVPSTWKWDLSGFPQKDQRQGSVWDQPDNWKNAMDPGSGNRVLSGGVALTWERRPRFATCREGSGGEKSGQVRKAAGGHPYSHRRSSRYWCK